jgi:acyl carrier protein phosphodiesterase
MNSLAHTFLSGIDKQVIIGNFIGDFVKGQSYSQFPVGIQKGILLHRSIDSFADNSPIVKKSKEFFKPLYGRYAGIIVDIVYDHFLSTHWHLYSAMRREYFIQYVYSCLCQYSCILPKRAQQLIPSIAYNNWMRYYASYYGLEKVLSRMALRTSLPHHTATCMQILRSNYTELEHNFNDFFPELQKYVLTL